MYEISEMDKSIALAVNWLDSNKFSSARGNRQLLDLEWKLTESLSVIALSSFVCTMTENFLSNKSTLAEIYEDFPNLPEQRIWNKLGFKFPNTPYELYYNLLNLLESELDGNVVYYLIKDSENIVGIFFLYNIRQGIKTANMGVILSSAGKNKQCSQALISSVIERYMKTDKEPKLVRLELRISKDNENTLKTIARDLPELTKEGLIANLLGKGEDYYQYAYTVK